MVSEGFNDDGVLKTCNLSRSTACNSPCVAVQAARLQVLHTPSTMNASESVRGRLPRWCSRAQQRCMMQLRIA